MDAHYHLKLKTVKNVTKHNIILHILTAVHVFCLCIFWCLCHFTVFRSRFSV